jgi:hypothetical protein
MKKVFVKRRQASIESKQWIKLEIHSASSSCHRQQCQNEIDQHLIHATTNKTAPAFKSAVKETS